MPNSFRVDDGTYCSRRGVGAQGGKLGVGEYVSVWVCEKEGDRRLGEDPGVPFRTHAHTHILTHSVTRRPVPLARQPNVEVLEEGSGEKLSFKKFLPRITCC
jgi:hypothetical protein